MADQPSRAVETPSDALSQQARTKFPVQALIAEGALALGAPSHVIAGALANENDDEVTLARAQKLVDAYREAPLPGQGE